MSKNSKISSLIELQRNSGNTGSQLRKIMNDLRKLEKMGFLKSGYDLDPPYGGDRNIREEARSRLKSGPRFPG